MFPMPLDSCVADELVLVVVNEICGGFDKFKWWLFDCTISFDWTHSVGGADNENVTGDESVFVVDVAIFCWLNGGESVTDDNTLIVRLKPDCGDGGVCVVLSPTIAWLSGTAAAAAAAAAFTPNAKLFGKKLFGCGICILMHCRLSIETAIDGDDDLSPPFTECKVAVDIGDCDIGCKLDICDVNIVGSAAVSSKPDEVGIKTGCANCAFDGPFVTKCCVRSLWLANDCGSCTSVVDNVGAILAVGCCAKDDFCDMDNCWSVKFCMVYGTERGNENENEQTNKRVKNSETGVLLLWSWMAIDFVQVQVQHIFFNSTQRVVVLQIAVAIP